jgi:hypothetical protein
MANANSTSPVRPFTKSPKITENRKKERAPRLKRSFLIEGD